MAGHSKWNNIKNRKGAADEKRAKVFAEVAKQIRIACKEGGSDNPQFNPSLRVALDKARAANMPKDKIQRALDRGMGRSNGAPVQEITYEGFGPHGVAVMVFAATDNTARTSGEVRHAFSKAGGSLGGPGSASYMFQKSGDDFTPIMHAELGESETAQVQDLLDALQELDDVEEVVSTLADEAA